MCVCLRVCVCVSNRELKIGKAGLWMKEVGWQKSDARVNERMGDRDVDESKFPHQFPLGEPPFSFPPRTIVLPLWLLSSLRPALHPQQICPHKSFRSTWFWHKCQVGSWPCAHHVMYNKELLLCHLLNEQSQNKKGNIKIVIYFF